MNNDRFKEDDRPTKEEAETLARLWFKAPSLAEIIICLGVTGCESRFEIEHELRRSTKETK